MNRKYIITLLIPLTLSSFTHLWNPIGFPDFFFDEGVYMGRAMLVLNGLGPQEAGTYYDHPYFGQLFLAGVFKLIGFPSLLNLSENLQSLQTLYLIPKLLIGLLAVFDTLLVYKISECLYSRKIALLASVLFAVMPITWYMRRILLEPIQLPFLLSSIFFAVYMARKDTDSLRIENYKNIPNNNKSLLFVIFSGVFLGIALFTKIPIFTFIPLIGYLIFSNHGNSWKLIGVWLIPVILLPSIWPIYSMTVNQLDYWWNSMIRQSVRNIQTFPTTLSVLFHLDPVLVVLSASGIIFAAIRRDFFILLSSIPFLLFLYFIGYSPDRLFVPLIPTLCIAAAVMIIYLVEKIKRRNVMKAVSVIVISTLGTFGFVSTFLLIETNVTSAQFQAAEFVLKYKNEHKFESVSIASNPVFSWIFKIYYGENAFRGFTDALDPPLKTKKTIFVDDDHVQQELKRNEKLRSFYDKTVNLATFQPPIRDLDFKYYPYYSLASNYEGLHEIQIRTIDNNLLNSEPVNCITYNPYISTIVVSCSSADLVDVFNTLKNSIIFKNRSVTKDITPVHLVKEESPKNWVLNANLEIINGTTFYINSSNTSWLKINSTGEDAYGIKVHGNLIIDRVKITSWNTQANNYSKTDKNGTIPRGYILINDGSRRTMITNSEIAYLGFKQPDKFGLTYSSGSGSIIKNNNIHDLFSGIYAHKNVNNLTIHNNEIYKNILHGIDSHSKIHNLLIKNNSVHHNGKNGIICSIGCNSVIFEYNKIYKNDENGIMLNGNVSNSTIRYNIISDNVNQLVLYGSSNENNIYNNSMSGGVGGITISANSSENLITKNDIKNSNNGITIHDISSGNLIESNRVINTSDNAVHIDNEGANKNIFKNNNFFDNPK